MRGTSPGIVVLASALLAACAASGPRGPTVALVIDDATGDEQALREALDETQPHLPVVLETRETPAAPPPLALAAVDFARVRSAYDDGDLEGCLAALPGEEGIAAALERGDRDEASRALYWRMACLRALGRLDEALAVAREHAARDLPIPPDVGAANATAETMLRDAHRDASATPPALLDVASEPPGASIAIDGAPTGMLTPARLETREGPHLVTLGGGTFAPRSMAVVTTSERATETSTPLPELEPEPAARALHGALALGAALDADTSLAMLATSLRARSLVLVSREHDRVRASLYGTGDEDGARRIVRAERVGEHTTDLEGLLRDVLVRGRLMAPPPAFYELPEVWIAVGVAVALAVGVTLGLTLEPEVHTRVVLP